MTRDGVCQTRSNHHELVLPFRFGRAGGPPHCVVETPELALGAGIHVAHSADYDVRLIIQIEAIRDEFVQVNLGRPFGPSITTARPASTTNVASTIASSFTGAAFITAAGTTAPAARSTLTRRPRFARTPLVALLFFCFCHLHHLPARALNALARCQSRPLQSNTPGRAQLDGAGPFADQAIDYGVAHIVCFFSTQLGNYSCQPHI